MQSTQRESTIAAANENPSSPIAINSSPRNRLDDLPAELRNLLANFSSLAMRAVLAHLPQFRIRSDDVLRARKLLCEWAAEHGYLELLKWAHEHDFPLLQLCDGRDACAAAAKGGQLTVLQWLREIRCHLGKYACDRAAEGGHLAVLQWLRERGCEWDSRVTLEAAQHGHLEVLEWALANGCELHRGAAFAGICRSGDLRIVEWAIGQPGLGEWIFVWEATGLSREVLRFMREHRPKLPEELPRLKALVTQQLASVGDLAGLQWARENGYFDPGAVCWGASSGGQLEVLKWAQESKFPVKVDCSRLARGGHLECLKWAEAYGHRPTVEACTYAAMSGHLSVLQWLRDEVSCEWNGDTLVVALQRNHWEVFDWARQHGCPVSKLLLTEAARSGHADVLQWAFETAGEHIKPDSIWCELAANAQVLKVLRAHGCEWSEQTCATYAEQGDLELLQWAVRNGCPWDEKASSGAFTQGNVFLLKWALENGCPMDAQTQQKWSAYDSEEFL